VKLSAIFGPLTYGLAVWLSDGDHRLAMLSLAGYFLVGSALLAGVDTKRGRRGALRKAAQV
jgi:UMF1 family MFS transporter